MNGKQIAEYLQRIGMGQMPAISEAGLDAAIWANLTHIPFENMDVICKGEVPSLDPEMLYQKIVEKKRGGYCFELNKLFLEFLRGCGFDAWQIAVRIVWQKQELPATTHRASLVRIGERLFLADVGYGGPGPKGVVELKDGVIKIRGSRFCIGQPEKGTWLIEREYEGGFSPMLLFEERPAQEVDFDLMNFYCAKCEKVIFNRILVCNLLTETGSVALTDKKLVIRDGDQTIEKELQTEEEVHACLKSCYGLVL